MKVAVILKGTGRFGNKQTSRDHLDYSIIKIGQNTEKGPGNLRTLAVTQTSVRYHHLMQERKILKRVNNNNNNNNNNTRIQQTSKKGVQN